MSRAICTSWVGSRTIWKAAAWLAAAGFGAGEICAQPANDAFASAETISGLAVTLSVDLSQATSEPGEPSHAGATGLRTAWYKWVAPRTGEVTVDTLASPDRPDTVVAVYTGGTLTELRQVAANDDSPVRSGAVSKPNYLANVTSLLRFHAEQGREYYLAVGVKPGGAANVTLSLAYYPAGTFRFASEQLANGVPLFLCTEMESLSMGDRTTWASYYQYGVPGVLVTVTRVGGSYGRVLVDYSTEDDTAVAGQDYVPISGTLIFDHGEMTKRILVQVIYNPEDQPNREFSVVLSNARPDPRESSELAPPRIDGAWGRAIVRILDLDPPPPTIDENGQEVESPPEVAFPKLNFRVPEDSQEYFQGSIRIPVIIVPGLDNRNPAVEYAVNRPFRNAAPLSDNGFALQPGSDYATPSGANLSYLFDQEPDFDVIPDLGNVDFLSPSSGFVDLSITNDALTEFNEDIKVYLLPPAPGSQPNWALNDASAATVTILFDDRDPPAGSVDQWHNPDYATHLVNPSVTYPADYPHPGTDGVVYDLAVQPDNRTIIVGDFTSYNAVRRLRIARLSEDGSLDTSFRPGAGADAFIHAIASYAGGRWIIAGGFTSYDGQPRMRVARILADGSLDPSFNPADGPNGPVWAVAVLQDGRVYIAGDFTQVNGTPRPYVARLLADGSLDPTFDPGAEGPDATVWALALQMDGKLLIGGEFRTVGGLVRGGIARLLDDGRLDLTFDPGAGTDGTVYTVRVQPDGKILVGGEFSQVNLAPRNNLARLTSTGALDPDFDPGSRGTDGPVYRIVLNGTQIYIGGSFDFYNGTPRRSFARLNPDGTLDTTFLDTAYNQFAGLFRARFSDPRGVAFAAGVQTDGNVMIAGLFEQVGGGQASRLTRPEANGDPNLWVEPKSRDGVRNRRNVARLLGGATPGPGNIGFNHPQYSTEEYQPYLAVELVRTNGNLGFLSANVEVEDGLARSGIDYSYNAGPPIYLSSWNPIWYTFPTLLPSQTRMFGDGLFGSSEAPLMISGSELVNYQESWVRITIFNDNLSQGDRNTTLRLSNPSFADTFFLGGENIPLGGALGRSQAPLLILDEDRRPGSLGFAMSEFVVTENVYQAVLTVMRTNGAYGTVSCRYEIVPGGTATPGADYEARSGTLTFSSGETSKTFTITIFDDSQVEPDETIFIRLVGPVAGGATVGLANAVVTVIDNDLPGGRLDLEQPVVSVLEGSREALVRVTRRGSSAGTVTVTAVTEPGTASANVDYTPVMTTLTWDHGDTSPKTFVIPLFDDGDIEPDETIIVRLQNPTLNGQPNPASLGAQSVGTVVIANDDLTGLVAFPSAVYRVNENSGEALITVVRTDGAADTVSVNFSATAGTAVPNSHFVATNGTLTFGPGEWAKRFAVRILDNSESDGGYRTVNLRLWDATPGSALGQPSTAELRIVDDESFNEPPGELDTLFVHGHFNDAVLAVARQADGKLLVGGDFTLANSATRQRLARLLSSDGTLDPTFQASVNGSVNALLVQQNGRILVGGAFTMVNGINRNGLVRLQANGTLDTTFDPGAGVDQPVFALGEGFWQGERKLLVAGAFTTVRSVSRRGIARLNEDGSVDLSFDPGSGADGIVYALVSYPTNGLHAGKVLVAGAFRNFNGRPAPGVVRLNPDGSVDPTFSVGAGPDGVVRALALQPDGRILVGGDFTTFNGQPRVRLARLLDNGMLDPSFDPGPGADDTVWSLALQPDQRIVVAGAFRHCNGVTRGGITRLNPDGSVDPSINFGAGADAFVSTVLLEPEGKIVLGGGFSTYDGQPRHRLARIYGGSVAGPGRFEFSQAEYRVWEDQTNVVIRLRRRGGTANAPDGQSIRVRVITEDETAIDGLHYQGGSFELVFPKAEVFGEITVRLFDDFEINAERTFRVRIQELLPAETPGLAPGNQPIARVVLVNDDTSVSFLSEAYAVSESVPGGQARITLRRQGNLERTTVVDFATLPDGTATPDVDFRHVTSTVTFLPGDTLRYVFIPVLDDSLPEADETVAMAITNVTGGFPVSPSRATLTIVDDEQAPGEIHFAQSSLVVIESQGMAVVPVRRSNGRSGLVSASYTIRPISATPDRDYLPSLGTVTFGDGETSKVILVPLIDDAEAEFDEVFEIELTGVTGGAKLVEPSKLSVTIQDDQPGFGFASSTFLAMESDHSLAFRVLRVGNTNSAVQVDYVTEPVTARADEDYVSTSGTLTFAPGEILKRVEVVLREDRLVEGDEAFRLCLRNPSAGAAILQPCATGLIVDNDTGFKLTTNRYVVLESHTNGVATNVVVEVLRVGSLRGTNSVGYTAVSGTATAGRDFEAVGGTLVFTNGQATNTVVVPILDDTEVEGLETFRFELFNPDTNAVLLEPSSAVVEIVDDDAGLYLLEPTYTVSEAGVSVTLTVVRSNVLDSTVSVDWRTEDGTAVGGLDYQPAGGRLEFPKDVTTQTLTVLLLDDTGEEGTESFFVRLFNVQGPGSLLPPEAATVTIVDNDGGVIVPAGSRLLSDPNGNGALDPDERVTVRFAMRNAGSVPVGNLEATLLPANGVVDPSGPQSYGALAPGGASRSRDFSFTVQGTNGGIVRATFQVRDGSMDLGRVTFSYLLGTRTATFSNTATIEILDNRPADPYPSVIAVTGMVGVVRETMVTISNLYHTRPSDIDMVLVSPAGQKVMLMSDAGGGYWITNVTLHFDDAAQASLSQSAPLTSGTFKPTDFGGVDSFEPPGPEMPFSTTLAAFQDSNPNGQWRLFIRDDATNQVGHIRNGWLLSLTTSGRILPEADVSVAAQVEPAVVVGSNWVLRVTVKNHGPWAVSSVTLTNLVPAGLELVSAQLTRGQLRTDNGFVSWAVGSLDMDQFATATLTLRAQQTGLYQWTVGGWPAETEAHGGNNTATVLTEVIPPRADLEVFLVDEPDPVTLGSTVTYTATITNRGPGTAVAVVLTNRLPDGFQVVSAPAPYELSENALVFRRLGDLGADQTMVLQVTVRPTAAGEFPVSVLVGSDTDDPAKANNAAIVRTTVRPRALQLQARLVPGGLELSWPADVGNVVVERADSLTPPVQWVAVAVTPVLEGGRYRVVLPETGFQGFFRLRLGP